MSFVANLEAAYNGASSSPGEQSQGVFQLEGSTPTSAARKPAKEGVDPEKARRLREDKLAQIRKNRRNDQLMTQRRRFVGTEDGVEAGDGDEDGDGDGEDDGETQVRAAAAAFDAQPDEHPSAIREQPIRHLADLPAKVVAIMSGVRDEQIDGISYFRKVLAIPKNPPIAEVMHAGVMPRIISFLTLGVDPLLQFEAAWCVTNIACGEYRYIIYLMENGVLQALVSLITNTQSDKVRSQALWALANLSGDLSESGHAARDMIIGAGALHPLLWLLGISDAGGRPPPSTPSLGTMQHLTYALVNMTKGPANLPLDALRAIVSALAELLQSPDDTVYLIVAGSIQDLCEKSEIYAQVILEHGIFSRMHQLLRESKSSEVSVRAFCAILRSSNLLHVKLAGSSRFPEVFSTMIIKMAMVPQTNPQTTTLQPAPQTPAALEVSFSVATEVCLTFGKLIDADPNYITKFVSMGIVEALIAAVDKGKHDLMVQAGACLCSLVSNAPSEQILMHCFSTVGVLSGLLALQNPDLQYNVLQTLRKLFEFVVNQAMHAHLNPAHVAHLRDTLSHLSLHPLAEICQIARTLEEILDVVST